MCTDRSYSCALHLWRFALGMARSAEARVVGVVVRGLLPAYQQRRRSQDQRQEGVEGVEGVEGDEGDEGVEGVEGVEGDEGDEVADAVDEL
jgi:hypothetical protein